MGTIETVRAKLEQRLLEEQVGPQFLTEWLQGHDMPGWGDDFPPYQWLEFALNSEPINPPLTDMVTDRTATLLTGYNNDPVKHLSSVRRPEEYLYNLLGLAGALTGDQLQLPLFEMMVQNTLSGEYQTIPLRYPLATALAHHFKSPDGYTPEQVYRSWLAITAVGDLPFDLTGTILNGVTHRAGGQDLLPQFLHVVRPRMTSDLKIVVLGDRSWPNWARDQIIATR